jgi:hypothetical protein
MGCKSLGVSSDSISWRRKGEYVILSSVRLCLVSVIGKDGERRNIETEAISLFDAAYKAKQQWATFWWFWPDALIEVRSGNECWRVRQDRLRLWATGSMRKRRREF